MQMLGYKANLTKSAFFSLCQINFYKIWNIHGVSYFSVCEHKMPTQFSRAASQSYWRETIISQTVLFFFVIFPLSGVSLWHVFMSHQWFTRRTAHFQIKLPEYWSLFCFPAGEGRFIQQTTKLSNRKTSEPSF